jgi:Flp pilus assembly protein TadD
MTKPVVVTVPLVLLLLDYWPLERFNWEYHPAGKSVPLGRLLIEKAPLFALTAALCVITLISQRQEGAVAPLEICHLDYRVGNMFLSYIRYIGKTIWPSRLAVLYPYPHINFLNTIVVVCALLFVLITVFCIYIGRRRKYIAVGWLLYVGTLVPMIGLVQVGSQAMADRYMYISMLGLLIIAAWSVKELVANRPRWRVVAAVLAVVALSSAIILTRIQARYWENGLTLFEHTLKVTENNAITENNYGCALLKADRLDKAVLHLSNALRISPTYPDARYNLGETFLRQGKLDEAIACFNELLRRKQGSADTYYNLAAALGMQKKYDDAIKYLTKVLELDPKYPNAYNNMGIALLATGKNAEAIKYLNEALLTNSNNAGLYENLGNAYIQTGNYELAIRNWTKALNLKPSSAEILNNLAWVLATTNDVSVRDANKAIEFATRSCELTENKKPEFMDTLAIAYAAAGRFEEAKATAGKALNIAKANKQEALAGEIQERIKLYEAGQPYREK